MSALETARRDYRAAGAAFLEQVRGVPLAAYDDPGLGRWDVRALVGHLGRSFTTVSTYLAAPAERVEVPSAAAYYLAISRLDLDPDDVRRRGVEAGAALGPEPLTALTAARDAAEAALDDLGGQDRLLTTLVGGMRISQYLPTRTFELVVHGIDLDRALGRAPSTPADLIAAALRTAVEAAALGGRGVEALLALTGREPLPEGFTIVP